MVQAGFRSNTLLIRFPIISSVYIVYRMHKVERRMVKTNAMNAQRDKIQAILLLLQCCDDFGWS